jgi:hypothetical protein
MGEALGRSLPLAVGVALSPVSIIAVAVLLTSSRARSLGPALVLGWLLGLVVVGVIVLAVVGPSGAGSSGQRTRWVSWVLIVIGVLLLVDAVRRVRGRTGGGTSRFPCRRGWERLTGSSPRQRWEEAWCWVACGPRASFSRSVWPPPSPRPGSRVASRRSAELLGRLKGWMRRNNAVILAVVLLVIGVTLIGDGIGGLPS